MASYADVILGIKATITTEDYQKAFLRYHPRTGVQSTTTTTTYRAKLQAVSSTGTIHQYSLGEDQEMYEEYDTRLCDPGHTFEEWKWNYSIPIYAGLFFDKRGIEHIDDVTDEYAKLNLVYYPELMELNDTYCVGVLIASAVDGGRVAFATEGQITAAKTVFNTKIAQFGITFTPLVFLRTYST